MPRASFNIGFLMLIAAAAALFATAAATVEHATPRNQLKRRLPNKSLPVEEAFVPIFDDEQKEYLDAHNNLRRKMGVPPLLWSPVLTAEARAWAESRRADCNYRSHSSSPYGENIFWMNYKEFTPTEVVNWWFNEYKLYDHAKHQCKCNPERAGCECGHYLNIVWSTTRQVGCSGATYCDNQKGVYVVCSYDPAGLIPGINPFTGKRL